MANLRDDHPKICRAFCSAANRPGKRNLIRLDPRSAVDKRWDKEQDWPAEGTDKEKDDFMIKGCDGLKTDEEVVPGWAEVAPGHATEATAELGDKPVRFGMQQICGCTMLSVVSRKRVYLGKTTQSPKLVRRQSCALINPV